MKEKKEILNCYNKNGMLNLMHTISTSLKSYFLMLTLKINFLSGYLIKNNKIKQNEFLMLLMKI